MEECDCPKGLHCCLFCWLRLQLARSIPDQFPKIVVRISPFDPWCENGAQVGYPWSYHSMTTDGKDESSMGIVLEGKESTVVPSIFGWIWIYFSFGCQSIMLVRWLWKHQHNPDTYARGGDGDGVYWLASPQVGATHLRVSIRSLTFLSMWHKTLVSEPVQTSCPGI